MHPYLPVYSPSSTVKVNSVSENIINPVTPSLEILSTTLIGDGPECVTADFFAHRDGDSPDVTGLWVNVSKFEMTLGSVNWLIAHFSEGGHEFPR